MSRYAELCELQQAALTRFLHYEQDCLAFTSDFFIGLKHYLECPGEQIHFHPVSQSMDISEQCSLSQAMHRLTDGFYEVFASLALTSTVSPDAVLISFRVKKNTDRYIVRVGMDRREFEVTGTGDVMLIYDHIYHAIKNFYQRDGYIKPVSNPIGFIV